MRPRTRLFRLISQELALKLKIVLYSCGWAACAAASYQGWLS